MRKESMSERGARNAEHGPIHLHSAFRIPNSKGMSLIAAIFILVILSFMGVMFVSLISTSSLTAINDMQSTQALYVAEGVVENAQLALAQNLDWYRSASDPMSAPTSTTQNLGVGTFAVIADLPATKLRSRMTSTSATPARVYTTDRFPTAGCVKIDDEFIQYTGIGSTAGACGGQPPCFTGIIRATCPSLGGGTKAAHTRGDGVYPATALNTAMPANCSDMALITIATSTKLLSAGTLDIEGEEVSYAGSSNSGGTMTLTGVQRCLGSVANVAHAANAPVTPVLVGDDSADYQVEITSTGTVGAAVRAVKKTVQR